MVGSWDGVSVSRGSSAESLVGCCKILILNWTTHVWFPSFKPHFNYFKISNPLYQLGYIQLQVTEKPSGRGSSYNDLYYILDRCLKVVGPRACLTVPRCLQEPRIFPVFHSSILILNVFPHGDKVATAVPSLTPPPNSFPHRNEVVRQRKM